MARTVRNARLETRSARLKLPAGKRHWVSIGKGLALGYRRPRAGGGAWTLRRVDPDSSKYKLHAVGQADDYRDADGKAVFDYFAAMERARAMAVRLANTKAASEQKPYLIRDAMADYLRWYQVHKKAYKATKHAIETHILPKLADRVVSELEASDVRNWHATIASSRPRARSSAKRGVSHLRKARDPRARKATANRLLTVLKAALNAAWRDHRVPSNEAWHVVKPFPKVDQPVVRYLSIDESKRLLNACPSDFRDLVRAALLTGCRYGELIAAQCHDFNADSNTLLIRDPKSGRPRHIFLTPEGATFFERLTAGRLGTTTMFLRADGEPWASAHQQRPMLRACEAAAIKPPASFHVLRHTFGSNLALRGVPLQVIAAALGHADTRITERHYAHLLPSYVADQIRANVPEFGLDEGNVSPISSGRRRRDEARALSQERSHDEAKTST